MNLQEQLGLDQDVAEYLGENSPWILDMMVQMIPTELDYHENWHFANYSGEVNRWMNFDRHYEALSYDAQKAEVEDGIKMSAPDPYAKLPAETLYAHLFKDGAYYAYGPNGWSGDTPIFGTAEADKLNGRGGDDFMYGDDGADTLRGGRGNDVLDGGRGDDRLIGGVGDDMILGNLGNDFIRGGKGDDNIAGGYGDDFIRGGAGDDLIYGDHGNNTIYGGKGDDNIRGGGDDDVLYGGAGDDRIITYGGNDKVYGGKGDDDMGGTGTFFFRVGDGHDRIGGSGLGEDVFISFEDEESITGFDDLRIEKNDASVHPGAHKDGSYRVWYSDSDYVDIVYGTPVGNPDWPLPEAPTADDFLFAS